MPIPRFLSLVKIDKEIASTELPELKKESPHPTFVFLGEIPQMPGHCVVVDYESGKVYSGYHTENFIELKDDEC